MDKTEKQMVEWWNFFKNCALIFGVLVPALVILEKVFGVVVF